MGNNKVSEKAVWEGSISPDNDTPSIGSQMQTQSQMMFCYKCNNVIPANSKFCPCCNIELYTTCPKCGVKYSSQYSICSQCGTNREDYLRAQRREQERKEAIERENRRKRLEEALAQKEQQEKKRRYEAENLKITETKECRLLYGAFYAHEKKCGNLLIIAILSLFALSMLFLWLMDPDKNLELFFGIQITIGVLMIVTLIIEKICEHSEVVKAKHIIQYIVKYKQSDYDQDILNSVITQIKSSSNITEENLTRWCIVAYRKKNGLPIL
ncbi:MAG: hypothetical protein U0L57_00500 [Bacteroidales bacterium]|nr:hypothetical protein [Bacteroidales bacterium]